MKVELTAATMAAWWAELRAEQTDEKMVELTVAVKAVLLVVTKAEN